MVDDSSRTRRSGGDVWKIGGPAAFLVLAALAAAYYFVDPSPVSRIRLATGEEGGAYARFGLAYRERLAEFGIDVELRETTGSRASLALLRAGEVDVAFVQGGVANQGVVHPREEAQHLASLGSLFFEPFWVFHRADLAAEHLADFAGQRLSIGAEGSGTRAVAIELLGLNGIDGPFEGLSGADALSALQAGNLDAVFLIASPESSLVRELLLSDGIECFSF